MMSMNKMRVQRQKINTSFKSVNQRLPSHHRSPTVTTSAILGKLFGNLTTKKNQTPDIVYKILETVAEAECGLKTKPTQLKEIKSAFDEVELEGASTKCRDPSGTWKLIWTTEKETLFILKNAKWFGTKSGHVYQVIDTKTNTLQNVITFPPEGAFIVDSSISWEADQPRVEFKFTGATLKLPSRDVKLPPKGEGWFDNVFISGDGKYRFSKDIRGDYLICERDGPPRKFE